jgi:hypothetical protein
MSERGILFLGSTVAMIGSLAAAAWLAATGQAANLDGIFLLATCLVLALAFGLYIVFAIRRALAEVEAPPAAQKAAAHGAAKREAAAVAPQAE